ncbi:hypothetical protein WICMUC_001370 [Wickerhamomyces mucosus]|uniref:Anaphase-promoting complex subunit 4 WD40 domain-containing protein n=1 Tax=Wickerhamomyces mucosus TaxID=1378264 RepID=A0A9P8THH5_9ASCO|nr:hypothetical protein WICMUC_001370 [Wickerhamomyces mucosus]
MSITREQIWAPLPNTQRAKTTHLSYDSKNDRIAYPSGKSIFIRSVSNPSNSIQFINHNHNTTVAKFSPSGNYIASGDESGNVKIWDTISDDLILKGEYQILNGPINDISWDSESKRIIAVGNGKELYGHAFTWDSGNSIGEISGHSAQINAVTIRPVRPYRAATVSDDSALVFYHGPPFRFDSSLRGHHTNFIRDVKFSPNGEFLVSVGMDKLIVLYDGKSGEYIKKWKGNEGGILSVNWVNNEEFVTSSTDSTIKLWKASTEELIKSWEFEKTIDLQQVGVIPTKDYIISLSFNGDLNYLSLDSSTPIKVLKGHQKSITSSIIHNDKLITGSYDGKIVEWSLNGESKELKSHSNLIVGLDEINDEIFSTGWDDKLKSLTKDLEISLEKQPKSTSSTKDLLTILTEDEIFGYSSTGDLKLQSKLPSTAIVIGSSSKFITIGYQNNLVKVYSSTFDHIFDITIRAQPSYLSISPNEQYLAIGDNSGKIILYNLETKELVTSRWAFHTAKINSISWRDNNYIVSGSLDTNVIIYQVEKPVKNIKFFGAHKDGVNFVKWIGENEIVTGGNDSTVKKFKVTFP